MATPGGGSGGGGAGGTLDPRAAAELAEAMKSVQAATASTTNSFNQQLRVMEQMRAAMADIAKNMGALCNQDCAAMSSETWEEASKGAKNYRDAVSKAQAASEKLAKAMRSKLATAAIVTAAAIDGLAQGFRNFMALSKSILGFIGSLVGGIFSVGKAIIAIPFKMMQGLFSMATKGGGGNELFAAYEKVRETFGSLKSDAASTVIGVARGMGKLDSSGVSAYRIFGNFAQRLEEVNKLATAMGSAFINIQGEFQKNGEALMRYQRGLGITDDQMGSIVQASQRMGTTAEKVLNDMTKQSLGMAKAFGVNAKILSRDMTKALQDVKNFGSLSNKEIGIAATYAQQLGVSVDKLTASMSATKTFDSTVDAVGRLNEAFGTNLEATELMNEENPAKQQAMIKNALLATGRDMTKLTRSQRDMIESTGLMSMEMIDASFAAKNAGVSIDKITKQADKNEKKTMSQAEAMHELSDAIVRLTPQGGGASSSIFGRLFEGFTAGIMNTKEFRALMMSINRILMQAWQYGRILGKVFVESFPGVSKILEGLTALFSPARWGKMFGGVFSAFDIFKRKGAAGMGEFIEEITRVFREFITSGIGPGGTIMQGFKEFGLAVFAIFVKLGDFIVNKMIEIVPKITEGAKKLFEWLKQPKEGGVLPKLNVPEWAKPLVELFTKVKDVLWPELKTLFKELWKGAGPYLAEFAKDALKTMFLVSFAPVVLRSIAGVAAAAATKAVGGMIKDFFFGNAAQREAYAKIANEADEMAEKAAKLQRRAMKKLGDGTDEAARKAAARLERRALEMGDEAARLAEVVAKGPETAFGKMSSKMGNFMKGSVGKMLGKAAIVTAVLSAAVDVSEAMHKFTGKLEKEGFDPATAKIAAGTTGLINTLTLGLLPESWQGSIATSIAKMGDFISKSLDSILGPGLSKHLKETLATSFDIFAGIGELVVAIFKGDSAGAEQAFIKIGLGLVEKMKQALEFAFFQLPKVLAQLSIYIIQGIMWLGKVLFNAVGSIFQALENVPILGPLFGLIGDIFKQIGDLFRQAGDAWAFIQKLLKQFDMGEYFQRAWKWLKTLFGDGAVDGQSFFGDMFKWIKNMTAIIEEPFRLLRGIWNLLFSDENFKEGLQKLWNASAGKIDKLVDENIIQPIMKFGSNISRWWDETGREWFKSIKKPFVDLWGVFKGWYNDLVAWGKNVWESIKKPFIDSWNWIKENFTFEKFKEIGGAIIDGFLWPLKKAKDLVVKPFESIIGGVKDVFGIASPSTEFISIGGNIVDSMMKMIMQAPEKVLENVKKILEIFEKIAAEIVATMRRGFNMVFGVIEEVTERILGFLEKNIPRGLKVFQDLRDGIIKLFMGETFFKVFEEVVNGVKEKLGKIADFGPFKALIKIAEKVFDIHSPSKVFMKIGDQIVEGIAIPMESLPEDIRKSFDKSVKVGENFSKQMQDVAKKTPVPGAPPGTGGPVQQQVVAEAPKIPDTDATKMIAAVANLGDLAEKARGTGAKIEALSNEAGNIAAALTKLPSAMAPIVSALVAVGNLLTGPAAKVTDTTKAFLDLLGNIVGLGEVGEKAATMGLGNKIMTLVQVAEGKAGGDLKYFIEFVPLRWGPIIDHLKKISDIVGPDSGKPAVEATNNFIALLKSLDELGVLGAKMAEMQLGNKIMDLVKVAEGKSPGGSLPYFLGEVPRAWGKILNFMSGDAIKKIPVAAATKGIEVFKDIVKTIQQMDDALSNVPKIDISTRMGEVANKLGLGSKGVYTVQSKEVVINVAFSVSMDVGKVEEIMVMRKESIIRDRINFALGGGGGKDSKVSQSIPAAPQHLGAVASTVP